MNLCIAGYFGVDLNRGWSRMLRFNVPFILVSASPRRRRLLEQLGIPFDIRVPEVEEVHADHLSPQDLVLKLALEKAESIVASEPNALLLAADTIVVLDGAVMGKPRDEADARAMLRALSDRTHTVYTGIALVHSQSDRCVTAAVATDVTFGLLEEDEIVRYVATGSPMDKAGAYGIQDDYGALFIARIDGDYYNVVGLPLHRFYRLVRVGFTDLLTA